MSPIPSGSRVLVTGANGYLATHVIDQLLSAGYHVTGTVRSLDRGEWLTPFFTKRYGPDRFDLALVPDMSAPDAFLTAMQGCVGVVHVASDVSFSPDPSAVIPAVEQATREILTTAKKTESVKRFVLTSSSAAACSAVPNRRVVVTEESWNELSVAEAWKEGDDAQGMKEFHVYAASKVMGEKALWKFVEENKGMLGFECNAVLPNFIMGPVLGKKFGQKGSTGGMIAALYSGDEKKREWAEGFIKKLPPQWMVNAADTAKLHVAALNDPDITNERIFAFSETYNFNQIVQILRMLRPQHNFPADLEDDAHDLSEIVPRARAEEILIKHYEKDFASLGETIEETLKSVDSE